MNTHLCLTFLFPPKIEHVVQGHAAFPELQTKSAARSPSLFLHHFTVCLRNSSLAAFQKLVQLECSSLAGMWVGLLLTILSCFPFQAGFSTFPFWNTIFLVLNTWGQVHVGISDMLTSPEVDFFQPFCPCKIPLRKFGQSRFWVFLWSCLPGHEFCLCKMASLIKLPP